jgi:hypothetical protein
MAGPLAGQFGVGLGGSVFANGFPGYPSAALPGASTVPEGPSTITQSAWGVPAAGSSAGNQGITAGAISTLALVVLAFIWWSLPR